MSLKWALVVCFVLIVLKCATAQQYSSEQAYCASIDDCTNCTANYNRSVSCFWCDNPLNKSQTSCNSWDYYQTQNFTALLTVCPRLQSHNDSCSCSTGFWPCSDRISGQLILTVLYGLTLAYGATLIADGSELLLEVVDPGVIGGLLLPLLGALPDAAIILVSGATGTQQDAQLQLNIGVGTLAGSTIMLLTIPWSVGLFLARCDIKHGESVDRTLTHGLSLTRTGATVDNDVVVNSKIMILTSLSYFIVQGAAFHYLIHPNAHETVERWYALAGLIVCFIFLILYSAYQVFSSKLQEKKIQEARKKAILELTVKHFVDKLRDRTDKLAAETSEHTEQSGLLANSPPTITSGDVRKMGLKWKNLAKQKASMNIQNDKEVEKEDVESGKEKEEEEGEEILDKKTIIIKAIFLMGFGTFLVSVFSDPMVDVLGDFAATTGINPFYVSFVITPICSNASETISSLIFAAKKLKKNSGLVFSQLYGAATMNNTLCLGIFYALVTIRELQWEFSAETLTILFVIVVVGIIGATQKTIKLFWGLVVISLYPISLVFVWILENIVGWQ